MAPSGTVVCMFTPETPRSGKLNEFRSKAGYGLCRLCYGTLK
jgi:hypothetical protein